MYPCGHGESTPSALKACHAARLLARAPSLLQYHREEGVILDSWEENSRRRLSLRAATEADRSHGAGGREGDGSADDALGHAGWAKEFTISVAAHMLMEAWQVRCRVRWVLWVARYGSEDRSTRRR